MFALVGKSGNEQPRLTLEIKLSPDVPDEMAAPEPFAQVLVVHAAVLEQRASILGRPAGMPLRRFADN